MRNEPSRSARCMIALMLMLHLLPIFRILRVLLFLAGTAAIAAVYLGWIGSGDLSQDASTLMSWSAIAVFATVVAIVSAWRFIPSVQKSIFPYLGGNWSGTLSFEGPKGAETRKITLTVKHTLLGIRLLLDSDESTSRTLVVHPDRDPDFGIPKLFYVYLNERKEGVPGAGQRYRGLAVMRIEQGKGLELQGDYFTETRRGGTLHLAIRKLNPWWMLWA